MESWEADKNERLFMNESCKTFYLIDSFKAWVYFNIYYYLLFIFFVRIDWLEYIEPYFISVMWCENKYDLEKKLSKIFHTVETNLVLTFFWSDFWKKKNFININLQIFNTESKSNSTKSSFFPVSISKMCSKWWIKCWALHNDLSFFPTLLGG